MNIKSNNLPQRRRELEQEKLRLIQSWSIHLQQSDRAFNAEILKLVAVKQQESRQKLALFLEKLQALTRELAIIDHKLGNDTNNTPNTQRIFLINRGAMNMFNHNNNTNRTNHTIAQVHQVQSLLAHQPPNPLPSSQILKPGATPKPLNSDGTINSDSVKKEDATNSKSASPAKNNLRTKRTKTQQTDNETDKDNDDSTAVKMEDKDKDEDKENEKDKKMSKRLVYCTIGDCTKKYTSQGNLNRHCKTAHNSQADGTPLPTQKQKDNIIIGNVNINGCNRGNAHIIKNRNKLQQQTVTCDQCDASFIGQSTLKRHINTAHAKPKPFHCTFDQCKDHDGYSTNIGLKEHLRKKHDIKTDEQFTFYMQKCKEFAITKNSQFRKKIMNNNHTDDHNNDNAVDASSTCSRSSFKAKNSNNAFNGGDNVSNSGKSDDTVATAATLNNMLLTFNNNNSNTSNNSNPFSAQSPIPTHSANNGNKIPTLPKNALIGFNLNSTTATKAPNTNTNASLTLPSVNFVSLNKCLNTKMTKMPLVINRNANGTINVTTNANPFGMNDVLNNNKLRINGHNDDNMKPMNQIITTLPNSNVILSGQSNGNPVNGGMMSMINNLFNQNKNNSAPQSSFNYFRPNVHSANSNINNNTHSTPNDDNTYIPTTDSNNSSVNTSDNTTMSGIDLLLQAAALNPSSDVENTDDISSASNNDDDDDDDEDYDENEDRKKRKVHKNKRKSRHHHHHQNKKSRKRKLSNNDEDYEYHANHRPAKRRKKSASPASAARQTADFESGVCSLCGRHKKQLSNTNWKQHLRANHKLPCPHSECNLTFTKRDQLENHQKKMHPSMLQE